ncbi:hypothetical protein [Niallia nealsonii]|uniref:Uncharacterized protein n=1 Tax=Niallia nealsonii TaxID=115979 RepID=A0A2N0Z186_9BACI|nr:hypothetical protein [Niallia nealsonii]PKG23271.1 hypothetical protein CWS01_12520 [Niallia nealsonii]
MTIYSQRLITTFYEFTYLLYQSRTKGLYVVSQTANLDYFDPDLQSMVKYGLSLLGEGLVENTMRFLLNLRKIDLCSNQTISSETVKLLTICIESCLYLSRGDYDDYRLFVHTVMRYEGKELDFSISQIIASLIEDENAQKNTTRQEFMAYVQKWSAASNDKVLSKKEIDKLLEEK